MRWRAVLVALQHAGARRLLIASSLVVFFVVRVASANDMDRPTVLENSLREARGANTSVAVHVSDDACAFCNCLRAELDGAELRGLLAPSIVLDADRDDELGRYLAKAYSADGAPIILFLSPSGDEIDRIIGFAGRDWLISEIKRIQAGKDTLRALEDQLTSGGGATALGAYVEKLAWSNPSKAIELAEQRAGTVGPQVRDRLQLAKARALENLAAPERALETYAQVVLNSELQESVDAAAESGSYLLKQVETAAALAFLDLADARARSPATVFRLKWGRAGLARQALVQSIDEGIRACDGNSELSRQALADCVRIGIVTEGVTQLAVRVASGVDATAGDSLTAARALRLAGRYEEALVWAMRAQTSGSTFQREAAGEVEILQAHLAAD